MDGRRGSARRDLDQKSVVGSTFITTSIRTEEEPNIVPHREVDGLSLIH